MCLLSPKMVMHDDDDACDIEYSPLISSRPVFLVTWYMFKTVTQAFSRFTDSSNHLHFL